jgi:hypothetical protein
MRGGLSLSLMCDLVPLDLEQQTAIANLMQPGGLTAVPACVSQSPLGTFDLGTSLQSSQCKPILFVTWQREN